jgi:hypothetical protein
MWYALLQNEQLGPMPAAELAELFEQGVLTLETLVWQDGMPEWVPLGRAPGFILANEERPVSLFDYANEGDDEGDDENATLMIGAQQLGDLGPGLLGGAGAGGAAAAASKAAAAKAAAEQAAAAQAAAAQAAAAQAAAAQAAAAQAAAAQAAAAQAAAAQAAAAQAARTRAAAGPLASTGSQPVRGAGSADLAQIASAGNVESTLFDPNGMPGVDAPPPPATPRWDPTPVVDPWPGSRPRTDDHFEAPDLAPPPEFEPGAIGGPADLDPPARIKSGGGAKLGLIIAAVLLVGGGAALMIALGGDGNTTTPPTTPATTSGSELAGMAPQSAATSAATSAASNAASPDAGTLAALDAGVAEASDAGVGDAAAEPETDAWILDLIDVRDGGMEEEVEPVVAEVHGKPKLTAAEREAQKQAWLARKEASRKAREEADKARKEREAKAAAAKGGTTANPGNLTVTLDRDDILSVIRANANAIDACGQKDEAARGTLSVAMIIQRTGAVSSAKVATARVRTSPAGACLEGVLKSLKFKAFSGDPMRINLPLKL